jgi:WD40 repeat protein
VNKKLSFVSIITVLIIIFLVIPMEEKAIACDVLNLETTRVVQRNFPDALSNNDVSWRLDLLAWHPDGQILAILEKLSTFTNLVIWNIDEDVILFEFPLVPSSQTHSFSWGSDGETLAAIFEPVAEIGGYNIFLWKLINNEYLFPLLSRFESGPGLELTWSPDNSLFATVGANDYGNQGSTHISVWRVLEAEPYATFDVWEKGYSAIAWHPSENKLAIADSEQTIIYDIDGETIINSIAEGATALAWHPDGRLLAGGHDSPQPEIEDNMWLWDTDTGLVTEPFDLLDVQNFLQWSSDGTFIASASANYGTPAILPSVGHLGSGQVAVLVDEPQSFYSKENYPLHTTWIANTNDIALAYTDGRIEIISVECEPPN